VRKMFVLAVLCLGLAATSAGAGPDQPAAFDASAAHVYKAPPGRTLTAPSSAPPAEVVARFLQGKGRSASALAALKTVAHERGARSGLTHLRMEQEVAGLRIEGPYLKAALDDRGELVHVIDALAPVPPGAPARAAVTEAQALSAALAALYPGVSSPAFLVRQGNVATFDKSAFFQSAPTVERVAIPMKSGALQTGFLVTTWTQKGNLLHETLVSGSGAVLSTELRTNSDRYSVFEASPTAASPGPQTTVTGPAPGGAESPLGWLGTGAQTTASIAGNNVHAYLDLDSNNKPDIAGTAVTTGDFLTAVDLTATPASTSNRNVAVQNLFYLNNLIHDRLFDAGFDEAAGNFQETNFTDTGRGKDSVNAEAQDGGGIDNANFATPRDGQNPRMQMYLWTGKGVDQVHIGTTDYPAQGAEFGPALDATGVTGNILVADDGTGTTSDACEAIQNDLTGAIAVIDRGGCAFVVKVKNAQLAGAVGAIIANNAGDSIFTMGGTDNSITIPSVFVSQTSGAAIKLAAGGSGTIRLTDPPPLQRDGDIDSDIVWHEYGHGLTWRMIGKMSGAMSGAIGEGMSDVLAVIQNNNDVVGEYAFNDPVGIRTFPYHLYFSHRTYGDVTGSEVHFDGEVYGAIGWRLWELYQTAGISREDLVADIVDGMNFTPAGPAFEDMRDGILAAVGSNTGHCNLVWQAFAEGGVGVGATSVTHGSKITVTESFTQGTCP
jgi:extracellular elastinolytic metalloproteinase